MYSFNRLTSLLLAALFGLTTQIMTPAMEVKGEGVDCKMVLVEGSEYTTLNIFPLFKIDHHESPGQSPSISHFEILEVPFFEFMDVNNRNETRKQHGCDRLASENNSGESVVTSFKTERADMPLFSLIDAVFVDKEQLVQFKFIDSPVFTLWSEERKGKDLENRQWEAFDVPLITTLAYKKDAKGTTREFLNTPVGDVYESRTCGNDSEMVLLDVPGFSLYESSTNGDKTQRSLLTSSVSIIDAPLFGIWSNEKKAENLREQRFLTLPIVGSLWSTETDGNDQVGRVFRIPIFKRSFLIENISQ